MNHHLIEVKLKGRPAKELHHMNTTICSKVKLNFLPENTNENILLLSKGGAHFDMCVLIDG